MDNILVVGNRNVAQQALLESLGISPGTPLLFVDLLAASARVEALDWVRAAELRRQLPDQLLLRVYERDPVALWQRGLRSLRNSRNSRNSCNLRSLNSSVSDGCIGVAL